MRWELDKEKNEKEENKIEHNPNDRVAQLEKKKNSTSPS